MLGSDSLSWAVGVVRFSSPMCVSWHPSFLPIMQRLRWASLVSLHEGTLNRLPDPAEYLILCACTPIGED